LTVGRATDRIGDVTAPTTPGASPETGRPGLRAARAARGWSQTGAARELAALGRDRGAPTASSASLKSQLSRWENGHATPDPPYRALLAELYGTDEAALGLSAPEAGTGSAGSPLPAALAEARAIDEPALELLTEQLRLAARLDRRLGPAGAADVLAALVERLTAVLDHTLVTIRRRAVATLLAEAAALAGELALDRGRTDEAWELHGRSRAAALEAGHEELAERAIAGRAAVLREAGLVEEALELLEGRTSAWAALARGEALAAAGRTGPARSAFDEAAAPHAGSVPEIDLAAVSLQIDVDLVHRRRSRALAPLGDLDALDALRTTTADAAAPVRERLAATTGLAVGLARAGHEREADERTRQALLLGLRIGADAVRTRLRSAQPPEAAR
jgi:transcriptional regulator with XRE-family HTH domain